MAAKSGAALINPDDAASAQRSPAISWTVNVKSLDDIEKVMGEGGKLGYRNFNIKVGPDPKFDVELAKRVKKNAPDAAAAARGANSEPPFPMRCSLRSNAGSRSRSR